MKKSIFVMALLALTHAVAYAHTELSSSMPADKATLDSAPKEVMLHFGEPVRLTAVAIQKSGDAKQELGPLPSAAAKDFALAAPGITTGEYAVTWRALSEDTHVLTGEFRFTVGVAGSAAEHSQPSSEGRGQHTEHSDTDR